MGGSPTKEATPYYTYTELLDKMFPEYLAIGMTPEQYWDGDCQWIKAFRIAHKKRLREQNTLLWLQGRYMYDSLCKVSPLLNAFSKKREPIPYADKPYPLFEEDLIKEKKQNERKKYEKSLSDMKARAEAWNKRFRQKT